MIKITGALWYRWARPANFQKQQFKRNYARASDNITEAPTDFTRQIFEILQSHPSASAELNNQQGVVRREKIHLV